jgi:predicted unusual protein kinase regulating ubiquinone biosynthesis (AarF/ABC1/UbiB family)
MVSIKVQNPALKTNVVKEAELLKNVATVANTVTKSFQAKTDSSEPTAGDIVDKLTSSIFEKTDYTNMEITSEFCTKNVVVTKVAMNDDSN